MVTSPESPLTREAIALVEVGHTEIRPLTARLFVLGFLVLIGAVPVIELRSIAGPSAWDHIAGMLPSARAEAAAADPASRWRRLIAGNRVVLASLHAFEEALEDESNVSRAIRRHVQLWMARGAGAGNERVYIGRQEWLFYHSDVEHVSGPGFLDPSAQRRRVARAEEWTTPPEVDPRPAILALQRDLDARGIALVVMPTPVKPTVHPEMLVAGYADRAVAVTNSSFERFVEDLRRQGVLVFDPADVLVEARRRSGEAQYLATDTHWRPEAMEIVAERLAEFIRANLSLPPVRTDYRTEEMEIQNLGDLGAMLDLPAGQTRYPQEVVTIRRVLQADGTPWGPSRAADVLVLGDSFSNIYSLSSMGWGDSAGFAEHVSLALRRPLDRLVQNDAGAYATRQMLRQAGDQRLAGKRIVIYQFATRELSFGDWKTVAISQ